MRCNLRTVACIAIAMIAELPMTASAISLGQMDNFEDGTVQNWAVNLLGQGGNQLQPVNVASGGPAGINDNYLKLTSVGGQGPSSRLVAVNLDHQWGGNYTQAGVGRIGMDLINLGDTELTVRLFLENPVGGPPTDTAITYGFILNAGSGWKHVEFSVIEEDLTSLTGHSPTLLSNVTALRILNGTDPTFPPESVAGVLGVDNIVALTEFGSVPEPAPLTLLASLLPLGFLLGRRRA